MGEGGRGERGRGPKMVLPTEARAPFLHGAEARTPKTASVAPLRGKRIVLHGKPVRHSFYATKHSVLAQGCPSRVELLQFYDHFLKKMVVA